MRYRKDIDFNGAHSIWRGDEWVASFADAETRDAVLAMLIERDEVK